MSLQHDFVRVDASDFCVQISRTRAEMINGPRRSRIGPKLTEIRASKVEKTRKTPGFPGHRRCPGSGSCARTRSPGSSAASPPTRDDAPYSDAGAACVQETPYVFRVFPTLEASISVAFQPIRLLLGPLIISARVLEI